MSEQKEFERATEIINTFISQAREELKERWERWKLDLSKSEVHEVVGALLARQVTLARQLAECPYIWNGHTAPLILRAMADVYISLAWILEDPIDRSRKFVLYGLGQEKLKVEHRKSQVTEREPSPEEKLLIEASETWINMQRYTFLTEVSIGSWSGATTRQMAEEAGCIDFYNYVYNPFSACAHSMWHHIGKYNLRQCANPLHQYHEVPHDPDLPIDPHYLYLAAKYLQKTFSTFDNKIGITIDAPSAFKQLYKNLYETSLDEEDTEQDNDSN